MRAIAVFKISGQNELTVLGPGDIIGRSEWAALSLEDPRISEAHALVSLRGQSLKLLALRGRFRHQGVVCSEVELQAGVMIELADGVCLHCQEVSLPDTLPGLAVDTLPVIPLTSTISVFLTHPPNIHHGYHPEADLSLWSFGESWRIMHQNQPPQAIQIGDTWHVKGIDIRIEPVSSTVLNHPVTRSSLRLAMTLEVRGDVVRIVRKNESPLLVSGIPGRIFAAVLKEGPLHWLDVVERVWPNDMSLEIAMRRRFDRGLSRLRTCLGPVLSDDEPLVILDGAGILTIKLDENDRIEVVESSE